MSTPVSDVGAMTREGFERLHAELEELVTVRRPAIADWLRDAREDGGEPGENAGVAEALEERALLEQRIAELRRALAEARIVAPAVDGSIGVGAYVRLRPPTGGTLEYQLVGAAEAEPSRRRISVESPVGQALLGRAAGETVEVDAPSGRREFEIVAVDYAGTASRRDAR
ncbi:MAG TPA: transcription elongation factor GreA [Solirubrobacteraceae bacterium]